jgi:hypothetical protein
MRKSWLVLSLAVCVVACNKGRGDGAAASAAAPRPAMPGSPEFDQKWSSLAQKDVDVFYIEDDRGEGLMGNVRRARKQDPQVTARPVNDAPQVLSSEDVQRVIRQNLPGVRACYLRISRDGDQRSGKAIVSFQVGPGGDVQDTKVDAPAFQGTSLPNCVSGTVSRWAFPKSQKGGLAISYPFVFVGG